jgi:hypothetical protein
VLDALASRRIELLLALRPGGEAGAARAIAACRERGVAIGLWPMLSDADGRWASAKTATRFAAFVRALFDALPDGVAPDTLAIDLEPPIREVRALLAGDVRVALRWARSPASHRADPIFTALADDARSRGIAVLAAVVPPLGAVRGRGLERLLGSPLAALGRCTVAPMAYTSLFEGYSRRVLRRRDARALLAELAAGAVHARGAAAALCLGAIGAGALGDERTYRGVGELADDVAIARAAGVDDLALFDLGGALARPPLEAWLDALVETPPARALPARTLRTSAAMSVLRAVSAAST